MQAEVAKFQLSRIPNYGVSEEHENPEFHFEYDLGGKFALYTIYSPQVCTLPSSLDSRVFQLTFINFSQQNQAIYKAVLDAIAVALKKDGE